MGKIVLGIPYELLLLGYIPLFVGIIVAGSVLHMVMKKRNLQPHPEVPPTPPISIRRFPRIVQRFRTLPPSTLWASLGIIVITTIVSFLTFVSQTPTVTKSSPAFDGVSVSYDKPIRLILNVPIDFRTTSIHTNPEIPFEWEGKKYINGVPFGREIIIYPKQSLPPETKIMIYLSNLKNPFSKDFGSEYLLEFTTAPLPDVIDSLPKPGAYDISGDIEIQLLLSAQDSPQSSWDVEIHPMEFISINRNWNTSLTLKFAKPLKQNTSYTVSVFRTPVTVDTATKATLAHGEKAKVYELSFSTVKAPLISTFSPDGENIIPTNPIEITFDDSMDKESVTNRFTIQPEVQGTFSWSDEGKVLIFQPQSLEKNTEYTVLLGKGLQSQQGGMLEQDIRFRFKTVGVVAVSGTSPTDATKDVAVISPIHIRFNQEVNKKTAEDRFSIEPAVQGALTWDSNILVFTPATPFDFGREYSYRISSGIQSIHGFDSASSYSYRFTTAPQEHTLTVPYFKQQENFTCNIAAIRMLLAFRGIIKTEQELKSEAGLSGSRGNGNPNLGYVSNYGTYWDAIAKVVGAYRSYRLFKEWTLAELLKEVQKGTPVMIWGQNGWSNPHEISWTASDGTYIYAINGMHSYIVRGWRGPIENPTHILVNDPWRGVYALSTSEFVRRWNFFKIALIVD